MASRSHTAYKKRQKELARLEKQREKAAKRQQRRQEKRLAETGDASDSGTNTQPDPLSSDMI